MSTENQSHSQHQGGRCPVQHDDGDVSSFWARLLPSSSSSSSPTANTTNSNSANNNGDGARASSSCPVAAAAAASGDDVSNRNLLTTAASLEEAARHAQTPRPDQTVPLGRHRQVSSIPRSTNSNTTTAPPHHQHYDNSSNASNDSNDNSDNSKWVYPSEQQLYNAMRRKGWSNVPEESVPAVLQIHNHVNEHTWRQIRAWEDCDDCECDDDNSDDDNSNNENNSELVLTRFHGRPRDLSPKAFFLSRVLRRCDRPFDRHDWYVARRSKQNSNNQQNDGNNSDSTAAPSTTATDEQRYVIDYYYIQPPPSQSQHLPPPVPHVDARPALDGPRAFYLRGRRFLREAFPGICAAYLSSSSPSSNSNSNNNNKNNSNKPSSS